MQCLPTYPHTFKDSGLSQNKVRLRLKLFYFVLYLQSCLILVRMVVVMQKYSSPMLNLQRGAMAGRNTLASFLRRSADFVEPPKPLGPLSQLARKIEGFLDNQLPANRSQPFTQISSKLPENLRTRLAQSKPILLGQEAATSPVDLQKFWMKLKNRVYSGPPAATAYTPRTRAVDFNRNLLGANVRINVDY